MKNNNELDCWLSRVNKILNILKIPDNICYVIDKTIKVRFGRYFLDEINTIIVGADGSDHNMLQLDWKLKGSFKQELYISNVMNRNQRAWLSRYRMLYNKARNISPYR